MHSTGEIIRRLWSNPEHQAGLRLVAVWQTWPEIIGPDLAKLVKPLGHYERTLVLGVEDAVVMQEASFQAPWILQAVNAFLGDHFFDKIRFNLIGGRTPLDAVSKSLPARSGRDCPTHPARQRPQELGALRSDFFTIAALERCYRTYVGVFNAPRKDSSTKQ